MVYLSKPIYYIYKRSKTLIYRERREMQWWFHILNWFRLEYSLFLWLGCATQFLRGNKNKNGPVALSQIHTISSNTMLQFILYLVSLKLIATALDIIKCLNLSGYSLPKPVFLVDIELVKTWHFQSIEPDQTWTFTPKYP